MGIAKQKEIQEKLAKIKEKQGKLTQADLDRANAEYELELKKIALEEAQNAKSATCLFSLHYFV